MGNTFAGYSEVGRSLIEPAPWRMRVVCAWCKRELVSGDLGAQTSHGSCEACAARLLGE